MSKLEGTPSWPKVEAARAAIAKHRGRDGDPSALQAAQQALGVAFEACRAEAASVDPDLATSGPTNEELAPEDVDTKVEKPSARAKSTKKSTGGGKKITSSKRRSSRGKK